MLLESGHIKQVFHCRWVGTKGVHLLLMRMLVLSTRQQQPCQYDMHEHEVHNELRAQQQQYTLVEDMRQFHECDISEQSHGHETRVHPDEQEQYFRQ